MEDVSDVFRRALINMHKMDKAKLDQGRKELYQNMRRAKKDKDCLLRRNIHENISPINSPMPVAKLNKPESSHQNRVLETNSNYKNSEKQSDTTSVAPINKRLEQLAKWKAEKAKSKLQEKAKAKPIFKVCHVSSEVVPNLENVNKTIKGKLFVKKSKFAPDNHKFRPPSNLKSVAELKESTVTELKLRTNRTCKTPKNKLENTVQKNNQLTSGKQTDCGDQTSKCSKPSTSKKAVLWDVSNNGGFETPSKTMAGKKTTFRKTPVRTVLPSKSDSVSEEILESPKAVEETSPIYISPFVTISRGKTAARNEYHTPSSDLSKYTSPKVGAKYFTKKLESEIKRIESVCEEWQKYLNEPGACEVAVDSINVAIGQSKLLISKKFQQFRSLIDRCANNSNDDQPVTCEDLHGFWDMMYMEVENIDKRFDNLKRLKDNNWEEMLPGKVENIAKKTTKGRKGKKKVTSKLKDLIMAQRQKTKEVNTEKDEVKIFDAGYFSVKSPVKEQCLSEKRRSLRVSVLTNENGRRCSASPGLIVMRVSQSIKQGNGVTPTKSILKSGCSKSTGKKSVLFKESCKVALFNDDDDDKENVDEDFITFTPRRSARLSNQKS